MMFKTYSRFLSLTLMTIAAGGPSASAEEPVNVLEKHGLTKSGKFFVIAAEEPALQKLYNIKPVMADVEAKYQYWSGLLQIEYEHKYLSEYVTQLRPQVNQAQTQVSRMPMRDGYQKQLKAEAMEELAMMQQELQAATQQRDLRARNLPTMGAKSKAQQEFKQSVKKFLSHASDLRPPFDEAVKQYEELGANDEVKNALRAYNQAAKVSFKLGPSDSLKKGVQQVVNYERTYSPDTAPRPTPLSKKKAMQRKKNRG